MLVFQIVTICPLSLPSRSSSSCLFFVTDQKNAVFFSSYLGAGSDSNDEAMAW